MVLFSCCGHSASARGKFKLGKGIFEQSYILLKLRVYSHILSATKGGGSQPIILLFLRGDGGQDFSDFILPSYIYFL